MELLEWRIHAETNATKVVYINSAIAFAVGDDNVVIESR